MRDCQVTRNVQIKHCDKRNEYTDENTGNSSPSKKKFTAIRGLKGANNFFAIDFITHLTTIFFSKLHFLHSGLILLFFKKNLISYEIIQKRKKKTTMTWTCEIFWDKFSQVGLQPLYIRNKYGLFERRSNLLVVWFYMAALLNHE